MSIGGFVVGVRRHDVVVAVSAVFGGVVGRGGYSLGFVECREGVQFAHLATN